MSTSGPSQTSVGEDDGEPPSPRSLPPAAPRRAWGDGNVELPAEDEPTQLDPDPAGDSAVSAEIGAGLGWLAGSAIGLMSLIIPIGTVLLDRDLPLMLAGTETPLSSDDTLPSGHLPALPLEQAPLQAPTARGTSPRQ
jgi:hypothetical protein